jgi:hypothetical protein
MVIVGSWGCMFYWCMFYVWENDVNNRTMTASELADRIKRGEKWQIDESELKKTEDRKILELAAKAAGIEYTWTKEGFLDGEEGIVPDGWRRCWNPLADDGDALRLAVKLEMDLSLTEFGAWVNDSIDCTDTDPYAATRRAIVLAAAEIGDS